MKNFRFLHISSNAAGGNIRRLLSVFLLISLTVSLCACSSGSEKQDNIKSGSTLPPGYADPSESTVLTEDSVSFSPDAPNGSSKEPTTLVLAATGLGPQLRQAIDAFYSTHDSVRIDIKDYSEYNTAT